MTPPGPPPGKRPGGSPAAKPVRLSQVWPEARGLLWAQRTPLAAGALLLLIGRVAGLVVPASSKVLIDKVIGEGRADLLSNLALAAGLAAVVQAVSTLALSRVVSVAAARAITDLRRRVHAHVLRLPVREYDATRTGVLVSRIMNDPDGVRNLMGAGLLQLAGGFVSAALALGVLMYLNVSMTLVVLALLAGFGFTMSRAFKRLRPMFRERGMITAEVSGRLTEALAGIRVVKTYGQERREERVFARGVHRLLRVVARSITMSSAMYALAAVVIGGASVVILTMGGRAVLSGRMTTGELVAYVFFVGLMVGPMIQVAAVGSQLSEAFAGLDRLRELREKATEAEECPAGEPVGTLAGDVELHDVSFGYAGGDPVLRDVSFRAAPGTTTALVGPSGAGKSTLIGLVMGFHRPTAGEVRVDGRDLSRLSVSDYRRHLGVVMQDNFLFDGTLRDNIAYSRPAATEEEIREAAWLAHCNEFIERFPRKLDTVVGERGVKLSGGQRQRIAIARAILANPRILILDEATSSLDSESEALIQDGLRSLREGRTTLVIAHRLSTIRSADQILVLSEGRVVQRGTHDELMEAEGLYRRLYERQARQDGDRFLNPGETPRAEAAPPRMPPVPFGPPMRMF